MTQTLRKASPGVYELVRKVFIFLEWLLINPEVSGLENVPAEGAFLAVTNHLSIADPPLLYIHIRRQMVMFAADKWKKVPGIRQLAELVGVIWVARGEADMGAIKTSLAALRSGQPMGLAPEGTRSRTGQLQKAKTGAAYLADRTGIPIVPIAISGTERFGQNLKRLRRTPVKIVVGQPFHLPPHGHAKASLLEQYTDEIMCRLAALLPAQYRGVYADHPRLRELVEAKMG
jgi:1-acyl-sn-glycerol-3-phosphate acyltransferase